MRPKTYDRAENLYRKHRRDPLADLLADTRAALGEAGSDHERAAIIRAASAAADTLTGDLSAKADFAAKVAGIGVTPEPYRVWSDAHQRSVSIDDLAAEDPALGKVAAAVRASSTAAEAFEVLSAAYAAREWGEAELMLMEGMREFEVVDDGTAAASAEERQAAEHAAMVAEAEAEEAATEDRSSRIGRLVAEAIAEREVREAEAGTPNEEVSA